MIHEQPVLARVPVSPNVGLNLVLGLVVGLLLGLLLAFPLMLLLDRTRSAGKGSVQTGERSDYPESV